MNRFTASVVLYNTPASQLRRLHHCLSRSTERPHLYLIDNSPTPTHLPFELDDWITYIPANTNLGYGAGHNVAIRRILDTSRMHCVLNPDIYFGPDELEKMLRFMEINPGVGQLMPKVTYPDGSLQYLCKLIPTPYDLFLRRFIAGPLSPLVRRQLDRFELRSTGYTQEMDVPYLSGCFMLFRVSALREIGLFDERFFMYPEDIDITRRMHARFRTVFFPGAEIVHDHARASYKSKRALWMHIKNLIIYFNKWGWFHDPERSRVNRETLAQFHGRSAMSGGSALSRATPRKP